MESFNSLNQDYLRLEIATLVNDVPLKSKTVGKFKINALVQKYANDKRTSRTNNIYNKNVSSGTIDSKDSIDITIPIYMRMFFNNTKTIPKGTRFIVSFIGANINDAHIVGLYDEEAYNHTYSYFQLVEEFKALRSKVAALDSRVCSCESALRISSPSVSYGDTLSL